MKKCPYCGEEINIAAKKCKFCGEWLVDEESSDNNMHTSKFCQFCGTVIPKFAEKCPQCGEWLVREEDSKYEEGNGNIVSKYIWSFMAVLAFIAIFMCSSIGEYLFAVFILVCVGVFLELYP